MSIVRRRGSSSMSAVAAAAVAEEKIAPTCAHRNPEPWRRVQILSGSIGITAGFGGKHVCMGECLVHDMNGENLKFVHLHKNARWFLSSVAGRKASRGDIATVRVLDEIRQKFCEEDINADATDDTTDDTTAVAEQTHKEADPMDALDDVPEVVHKARNKPAKKNSHAHVRKLTMPKRPPCLGVEEDQTTVIYVVLARRCPRLASFVCGGREVLPESRARHATSKNNRKRGCFGVLRLHGEDVEG